MAYFYQDWKDKKMTVEVDGQFMLNFAEAELQMAENLENSAINLREGASDEKEAAIRHIEHIADCLRKGKLELKWNIS
jgi:hypothetical protein|tara:strand:+ start:450 stop:683 length:234 start_codon:yes stop_codon:yes gene_type:complete